MAIIECPECGKEVSTTASHCPNCGYNIKRIIAYCIACELDKKKKVLMQYDKEQDILICPECGHTLRFTTPEEEAQIEQNRRLYEIQNSNKVTCPYCSSANIGKITTVSRMVSTGLFGLGSKKIGKQYHCNNCGSDF